MGTHAHTHTWAHMHTHMCTHLHTCTNIQMHNTHRPPTLRARTVDVVPLSTSTDNAYSSAFLDSTVWSMKLCVVTMVTVTRVEGKG